MSMEAWYIILTAGITATNCALLGSFLILRKMAMVGDAVSHAVLPGIVIAFLISGGRDNLAMLIGAAATGVLATILIELLNKKAKLQEDASIGISFTWLFAIGVILISTFIGEIDIDEDCVLYGEIAYVPLDLIYSGSGNVIAPRALLISAGLLVAILIYITLGYKGLKISTFNSDFAKALGINTLFWHFSFMSMVSITTVFSFESVGAILIVALLVVPAATAYLINNKLKPMLFWSVGFGLVSSVLGYYLAAWFNSSIAGAMVTVAGLLFLIVFIWLRLVQRKKPSHKSEMA